MITFRWKFDTPKEHTRWINQCKYIIIHHTGTKEWTIKGVIDWLYRRPDYASCHFLIDFNGDIYKFWNPEDILWHCWASCWGKDWQIKNKEVSLNPYAIGIEVLWPLTYGFDDRQRKAVKELTLHLMNTYWIKINNVLRHADITWEWRYKCIPRDNKTSSRKVDISKEFFYPEFRTFEAWKEKKLT